MLKDKISKETILLDFDVKDKLDLFTKISKIAKDLGIVNDAEKLVEDFYEKEQTTETYLGTSCAIPHARSKRVLKNAVFFIRTNKAVNWSDDSAKYIFAILAKEEDVDTHIDMLMSISKKILVNKTIEVLTNAVNEEEILEVLTK